MPLAGTCACHFTCRQACTVAKNTSIVPIQNIVYKQRDLKYDSKVRKSKSTE